MASSPVVVAFRLAVVSGLAGTGDTLRDAIGRLPGTREMARALLLTHRAAVAWAGETIALTRPTMSNPLQTVVPFEHPEAGTELLYAPARTVQRDASSAGDVPVLELTARLIELGAALSRLAEDAPLDVNAEDFGDVGRLAGEVLLLGRDLRQDENWAWEQADQALVDLIQPGRLWRADA